MRVDYVTEPILPSLVTFKKGMVLFIAAGAGTTMSETGPTVSRSRVQSSDNRIEANEF